jgi:hypothetical protein
MCNIVTAFTAGIMLLTSIFLSACHAEADELSRPNSVSGVQEYLEGAWLEGAPADKGDCRANWYDGKTEIEFEFRRSGGRVMIFEPYDLFQQIQIPKVEVSGDTISLFAQSRSGTFVFFKRLRIVTADELVAIDDGKAPSKLYRCSAPDRSVNAQASTEDLRLLTAATTGGLAFPQAVEGVSDEDICSGKGYEERMLAHVEQGTIQFEVLGPVHFWIIAGGIPSLGRKLEFDLVRSVRTLAPGKLKLTLQRHDKFRDGWDPPGAAGEIYELTVVSNGNRIEIPEIGKVFVRCSSPGRGMHRWGQ